jgi:small subunit ribosomal protein S5
MAEEIKKTQQIGNPIGALTNNSKVRIVQRRVQGKQNTVPQKGGSGQYDRSSGHRQYAPREADEFETQIISMGRVTKVTGGGKRMRMSVFVVVGDKKGNIGLGNGKALDIKLAQEKAVGFAKRHMVKVTLKGNTIPHEMNVKFGAAKLWMKPAAPGTGIVAGGPVRKVLELAGVKDVLTKQIGTSNQVSNAYATLLALKTMKK